MKSISTWSSWWWTVSLAAVRSRQLSDGGSIGAIGGHRDLSFLETATIQQVPRSEVTAAILF